MKPIQKIINLHWHISLRMKITPKKIACTEPQYGGLAVFDAMAMINWDTCGYYNYSNERSGHLTQLQNNIVGNKLLNSLKIYPNPTQSNLTIEFSHELEINSISVSDISGSQITCNYTKRKNQLLIETINLAKGYYIVKLIDNNNNIFNVSFIKE